MRLGILRRTTALAGAVAVGLSGCSGGVKTRERIAITSQPSGATVYATGAEIGRTPLQINPGDVFSAGFARDEQGLVYRYKGTLSLKRPGCEIYVLAVNDAVLAGDIHAVLDCKPGAAHGPAPSAGPPRALSPAAPVLAPNEAGPIEQRLRRARRLYEMGLITEGEYRKVRDRILGEL